MNNFIQELIRVQDVRDLYDGEMANKIGCTRQWYWAIREGRAKPSVKFMNQVKQAFPEMAQCVRESIMSLVK